MRAAALITFKRKLGAALIRSHRYNLQEYLRLLLEGGPQKQAVNTFSNVNATDRMKLLNLSCGYYRNSATFAVKDGKATGFQAAKDLIALKSNDYF